MAKYIWQYPEWPQFTWDEKAFSKVLGEVRLLQGKIFAWMNMQGMLLKEESALNMLTLDVVKSSEIEGELLNYQQVRSSIARRLGFETAGMVPTDRFTEGVVEMMLDATQKYQLPLEEERLFSWHAALFPLGRSGMYKIEVGQFRNEAMQIVSGAMGKEKVHYEAPPPETVKKDMDHFLFWFNNEMNLDPVLKAAIAHFWFIIIHPFDDGNGRIARAITDMQLTRSDESPLRYYSMSNQIMIERKQYYEVLQKVQHSQGDITEWILWFLQCLKSAMLETEHTLQKILYKAKFWDVHQHTSMNERQRFMLNKLLDGFEGKLKTSKWAKINKCSADTALRDIKDLIEKGVLKQENEGGRSTNYELVEILD